jgi:hypothetical protein
MAMLSDDDLDLVELSAEDLDRAWDLWFDLAQSTNDADPCHTHGVFVTATIPEWPAAGSADRPSAADRSGSQ